MIKAQHKPADRKDILKIKPIYKCNILMYVGYEAIYRTLMI